MHSLNLIAIISLISLSNQLLNQLPITEKLNYLPNNFITDLSNNAQDDIFYCGSRLVLEVNNKVIAPEDAKPFDVTFLIFTQTNRDIPDIFTHPVSNDSLLSSHLNKSCPIKFVIHGWMQSYNGTTWMRDLKNDLLDSCDCLNVIAVDWSGGAGHIDYFTSAYLTRFTCAAVANLIYQLSAILSISASDVHLIGHSLGAQICGCIGTYFNAPQIALIVGLEPAGPGFGCMNQTNRLNSNNAAYVVAFHTNGGFYGLNEISGDLDFYANNGQFQPGCDDSLYSIDTFLSTFPSVIEYTLACSHFRAFQYPISSSNTSCKNVGCFCDCYENFENGKCGDNCLSLNNFVFTCLSNINNTDITGNLYFDTNSADPYCVYQYQILITISKTTTCSPIIGQIWLSLNNQKITLKRNTINTNSGQNNTYLGTSNQPLGTPKTAKLGFNCDLLPQCIANLLLGNCINIVSIAVNSLNDVDPMLRKQNSAVFTTDNTVIYSGKSSTFTNN